MEILKEHISSTSTWSQDVASFIRNNDEKILKSCEEVDFSLMVWGFSVRTMYFIFLDCVFQLLSFYQNDLLPTSSFPEYCDVAGKIDSSFLIIYSVSACLTWEMF